MNPSELYEPLLERDLEAFRARAAGFRDAHGIGALLDAVTRFVVLSYSPSQHGKHALIACRSAREISGVVGARFTDLLVECAIYAAQSRLPWSEPPITDPPPVDESDSFALEEIRAAVRAGDRLRGERWLARRMREADLGRDFFAVAADDFGDLGHKLIVSVASWRLAGLYPESVRFGILRNAVVEWCAYNDDGEEARVPLDGALVERVIDRIVADEGAIDSFHLLALLDAAIEGAELGDDPSIEERAAGYVARQFGDERRAIDPPERDVPIPVYSLARDCGAYLKAWAIRARLRARFPTARFDRLLAAARYNLEEGPSMEPWT